MAEYRIPYRIVLEGDVVIEADSAEEAERAAELGKWDDPHFKDLAEIVDWKVRGRAKEYTRSTPWKGDVR